MPEAIKAAGHDVRPWYDHFPGKPDDEWLPQVGALGWIVLTKDKNIRRTPLEIAAILNSGVKAFVLTATGLKKEDQAEILVRAMRKIRRVCVQRGPFIFNITRMGNLSRISNTALKRRSQ